LSVIEDVNELIKAGIEFHKKFEKFESIISLMKTEPRPWDRHFLLAAQINLFKNSNIKNIIKSLAILGNYM